MNEKRKKRLPEKTLFETEQQSREKRIFATAGEYISGRVKTKEDKK